MDFDEKLKAWKAARRNDHYAYAKARYNIQEEIRYRSMHMNILMEKEKLLG